MFGVPLCERPAHLEQRCPRLKPPAVSRLSQVTGKDCARGPPYRPLAAARPQASTKSRQVRLQDIILLPAPRIRGRCSRTRVTRLAL
jgi:hypothetical protein